MAKREIASVVVTFDPNTGNIGVAPDACTQAEVLAILEAAKQIVVQQVFSQARSAGTILDSKGMIPGN